MGYSDERNLVCTHVGSGGQKYYQGNMVCHHQMCIFSTSFAYLFWLANNKQVKYWEFCMDYSDETVYVGG